MIHRILLALTIAFALTTCKRSDALIIATDATYPPFEFIDEHGEFAGVDVELGRALAKHLGRDVQFKNIAWEGIITALQSGNVDVIISAMTASDDRRKTLDFSDPYVTTGICLLLPKASTVSGEAELKRGKRRIVVKIGTTGEQWSRANLPEATVVPLDTDAACVMEVIKGSADAWVYDQISVMSFARRNPDTTKALLAPLRAESWAIAMKKGQPELKAKIDAFIAKYRAEGGFDALAARYMADERAFMKQQGLPFVF